VIYRFGPFTLDSARRELSRDGAEIAVEPQVFDLLRVLIERRDRVVSRDDLLEAVWNGRIVSEATLGSRINAARTAIGDTGTGQRWIRTLPRKGVRFVGAVWEAASEVSPGIAPEDAAEPGVTWRAGPRLPAVAVLPFTNMSADPEQDYFADGMTEEIITALSRVSGLFVIARNSTFTYRGAAIDVRRVGQELGVGYVVAGSVRRGGSRLRITGQLVDAGTGAHLWADSFDGGLDDVFALQERVAARAAAAIEPTLQLAEIRRLGRDAPAHPDAYDRLLRANARLADFTAAGMAAALDHLDEALALDPGYAPAMAAAAYCRAQCHFQGWIAQGEAERAAAVRLAWGAVERAPGDAQVLFMAAFAVWNMSETGRDRARGPAVTSGRSRDGGPSHRGDGDSARGRGAASRDGGPGPSRRDGDGAGRSRGGPSRRGGARSRTGRCGRRRLPPAGRHRGREGRPSRAPRGRVRPGPGRRPGGSVRSW